MNFVLAHLSEPIIFAFHVRKARDWSRFGTIRLVPKEHGGKPYLTVIGGGLAGSEAAWQAGERGIRVVLYEMRPRVSTGAHLGAELAELVCSNSLGSSVENSAAGLLQHELRLMHSLLMACADQTSVPAGGALAVDREAFAREVTWRIEQHPNIKIIREELTQIPLTPAVIATGPLTSSAFSAALAGFTGKEHLYFYDAIAPIVLRESVNMNVAYRGSRYGRGELDVGDYINCPMNQEQYEHFIAALVSAERIALKEFERDLEQGVRAGEGAYFEGCLPVEILARRGDKSLAYGPLKPVGLSDASPIEKPCAVVQLRQDNLAGTLYNMVGFQTNLTFAEQKRVFRMIPGLEQAEFARYGQMHRNTFVFSPELLQPTLQSIRRQDLFFAGQITGVEGYVGNIATGLLAGANAARWLSGKEVCAFPETTMVGALCHYVTRASSKDFQPMKANLGLLPPLEEGVRRGRAGRSQRAQAYVDRAIIDMELFLNKIDFLERESI